MNDFSGEINGIGPKVEEWVKESNTMLKEEKIPYKVVKNSDFLFFKIFSVILLIGLFVLGGYFLYYLNQGKLQSNVNIDQPITVNPTVNSTSNINNDYQDYNTNNNSFTFNFNIDKELLKRYCNLSNYTS